MLTESERLQMSKYLEHVRHLATLPDEEVRLLVADDKCPFQPTTMRGLQTEEHSCPLCGVKVYPGIPHPRRSDEAFSDEELAKLAGAGSNVDQLDL